MSERRNLSEGWVAGVYRGEVLTSRVVYNIQAGVTVRIHQSTDIRAHNREMVWAIAPNTHHIYPTEHEAIGRLVGNVLRPAAAEAARMAEHYTSLARQALAMIEGGDHADGSDAAHAGAKGPDARTGGA